jgi:uncharacterized membrane protein
MIKTFAIFLIGFLSALAIDYLWVGILMKKFYRENLGSLARIAEGQLKINLPSILLVYVLFVLALMFFALPKSASAASAFFQGAILGFLIYGIYDLTNMGFLANWSLKLSIVDIIWGTFLSGTVNLILYFVSRS